jgi:hypothetical protein
MSKQTKKEGEKVGGCTMSKQSGLGAVVGSEGTGLKTLAAAALSSGFLTLNSKP